MSVPLRHHICYAVIGTALFGLVTPAAAYLEVNPTNPHYFLETRTGKPIMLVGYNGVAPGARANDDSRWITESHKRRLKYGRVWLFTPWAGDKAIWPWRHSDIPGAYMGGRGGNKFDLNQWNPDYWNRLDVVLAQCRDAGIYMEIHLFDRCGMSPASDDRWGNNPWASDNNCNHLETPTSKQAGTPAFYRFEEKPNLRIQQERYVRKLIDETIRFPNLIYEIENEHQGDDSPAFGSHYADFVKRYLASHYTHSPRLVSYSSVDGDLDHFYRVQSVDIVNRHFGTEAERDPELLSRYIEPRWRYGKAINIDEFANGIANPDLLRRMCWTIVMSGGNFHIEDALPAAHPFGAVQAIQRFLTNSGWDFIHSAPDSKAAAGGKVFCMARAAREYAAYIPNGGAVRLDIPAGRYRVEWWDPRTGRLVRQRDVTFAGSKQRFITPDKRDWTLHVVKV